jgi:hypothetical protein
MRRLFSTLGFLLLTSSLSGCPTTFSGSAHVVGGRAGCEQKCKKSKLRMSALVFLGEYSSACVCEAQIPSDKTSESGSAPEARAAGSVGAAVTAMQQTSSDPEAPMPPLKW